jgi:hypothetical protein
MNIVEHRDFHKDFESLTKIITENYSEKFASAFIDEYYNVYEEIANYPLSTRSVISHPYGEQAVEENPKLKAVCYKVFSKRFRNYLFHLPIENTGTNYMLALLTSGGSESRFINTLTTREQTKEAI